MSSKRKKTIYGIRYEIMSDPCKGFGTSPEILHILTHKKNGKDVPFVASMRCPVCKKASFSVRLNIPGGHELAINKEKDNLTILGSIQNMGECNCHFFITEGRVEFP